MVRKFDDWWNTVPADLKQKARKGDEANKPLLNQINYVLLHLHLAGKHDAKPTHDELKDWLHSGQVDVQNEQIKQLFFIFIYTLLFNQFYAVVPSYIITVFCSSI